MNDSVKRHNEFTRYLDCLYEKKNKAYGDSFHETYKKLGIISAITRITDKYNRLVNLATHTYIPENDESIQDTLLDLANYAIMTAMELDDKVLEKAKKDNDFYGNVTKKEDSEFYGNVPK